MVKYWRAHVAGSDRGLWIEDDGRSPYVIHADWSAARPGEAATCERRESLRSSLKGHVGTRTKLSPTTFQPGEYHPRIWRQYACPKAKDCYLNEWSSALLAARNLYVGMRDVFRHVEPTKQNRLAYGHETRQLLVLACIEVEAQLKAVLRANNYQKSKGNWTIVDYFKLARPMRLSEWSVSLIQYPGLGWLRPFRAWSGARYRPLTWYAAYNKVKHDRELEFSKANLQNLIDAMAAVFIVVVAQFGQFGRRGWHYEERDDFAVKWPLFLGREHYVPPHVQTGAKWHPRPYF